ncbi:MAG TPA: DUF1565 domain-containing protein, partial [Polyangiaceae bacterium]|nr:DUF1565 domain-containing protein [Polyangiaceae bacterium]
METNGSGGGDGSGGRAGTGGSDGSGGQGTGGGEGPDGSEGDYYVAVDGSDSGPGTIEQPFATLQKAINVAQPGELVYVRGGVYNIVQGTNPATGIHFNKSGRSDTERIRYFAYP